MTNRRDFIKTLGVASAGMMLNGAACSAKKSCKPNIILIMTDDQGWGQTGYYNHPVLKTPNLDAMAKNGLRFDRFYAGAPVCSPTRASILTGRANDRTGVPSHGKALRLQEKTLPSALKAAGYSTGHFGKWHLNGIRGPGVPVLGDDDYSPGVFGFEEWLTVTNFFDINPIMSNKGTFKEFKGDTSAIIVDEALKFISNSKDNDKPSFSVIWDGSPHAPWVASDADKSSFKELNSKSQNHYGELVAFDRSLGVLRKGLRDLNIAENTLIWFCSDNGGLPGLEPDTVGGLRGHKGSVWEGGLRVPCIIEWPSTIKPNVTNFPASTMDIFPTIAEILNLPASAMLKPIDGTSINPLLSKDLVKRKKLIPFKYHNKGALVDNNYKLVVTDIKNESFELYNLKTDPKELKDISKIQPEIFNRMKLAFKKWTASLKDSVVGKDYPEKKLSPDDPKRHFWMTDERYKKYLDKWRKRPEYAKSLKVKSFN